MKRHIKKFLPVFLIFFALVAGSSCASKKPDFGKRKKPTTYYPNKRKAPSGVTDNCDCSKGGRNRSRVKKERRSYEGVQRSNL